MKPIRSFLVAAIGLIGLSSSALAVTSDKQVIGPVERLKVSESSLTYRARIDTGATRTALHALDIKVEDAEKDDDDNIGKWITFTTLNNLGQSVEVRAQISDVVHPRNSMGTSTRYVIPLTISWHGVEYVVEAALADRSRMSYKLLVGRDWLSGRYVVDVDYPEED